MDSNPRSPREDVKGQDPPFHADYPPIGWACKQHMKRMLNGVKRYGITCPAANALPAGSAHLKLIRYLVDGRL
jgi:hypothetical protein